MSGSLAGKSVFVLGRLKYGLPYAEDAKEAQRTQKKQNSDVLLRLLRNLCVLCVRVFGFHFLTTTSPFRYSPSGKASVIG
jgi:hypothetical protein